MCRHCQQANIKIIALGSSTLLYGAVQLVGNFALRLVERFRPKSDFSRTVILIEKLKGTIFILLVDIISYF